MTKHIIYNGVQIVAEADGVSFHTAENGDLSILNTCMTPIAGVAAGHWTSYAQLPSERPTQEPPFKVERFAGQPMLSPMQYNYFLFTPEPFTAFSTFSDRHRIAAQFPARGEMKTYTSLKPAAAQPKPGMPKYNMTDQIRSLVVRGITLTVKDVKRGDEDHFYISGPLATGLMIDHRPSDAKDSGERQRLYTFDVVFHKNTPNILGEPSSVINGLLEQFNQTLLCAKIGILVEANYKQMLVQLSSVTKWIRGNIIIEDATTPASITIDAHAADMEACYMSGIGVIDAPIEVNNLSTKEEKDTIILKYFGITTQFRAPKPLDETTTPEKHKCNVSVTIPREDTVRYTLSLYKGQYFGKQLMTLFNVPPKHCLVYKNMDGVKYLVDPETNVDIFMDSIEFTLEPCAYATVVLCNLTWRPTAVCLQDPDEPETNEKSYYDFRFVTDDPGIRDRIIRLRTDGVGYQMESLLKTAGVEPKMGYELHVHQPDAKIDRLFHGESIQVKPGMSFHYVKMP